MLEDCVRSWYAIHSLLSPSLTVSLSFSQEIILLDPMFEIPGSDIRSVEIDESVVMGLRSAKYVRESEEREGTQDSYDASATRAVNS